MRAGVSAGAGAGPCATCCALGPTTLVSESALATSDSPDPFLRTLAVHAAVPSSGKLAVAVDSEVASAPSLEQKQAVALLQFAALRHTAVVVLAPAQAS